MTYHGRPDREEDLTVYRGSDANAAGSGGGGRDDSPTTTYPTGTQRAPVPGDTLRDTSGGYASDGSASSPGYPRGDEYQESTYSPTPEARPRWAQQSQWQTGTPGKWLEPGPGDEGVSYAAGSRGTPETRKRSSVGLLPLLLVSLLSAALASGGTYLALQTSRDDSRPAAAIAPPSAQPAAVAGANGDTQPVTINEESAVTRAAAAASPAIVTITTGQAQGAEPFELPATGVGSGILYDSAGWILTNRHVVVGAERVRVELQDRRRFDGRIYGIDTLTDLAIVKIEGENLPVAEIGDSSGLKPGQLAVAIGSPLGTFTNSVTSGVVSALGRQIAVQDQETGQRRALRNLIQTDAPINPGNSGGALVDSSGRVIGVNTAVAGGAQGIGFAIPINIARPIMEQAVAGEKLSRPFIGINYEPIDPNVQVRERLPIDYGVWVGFPAEVGEQAGSPVVPRSPADRAGIRAGDIIMAINGERIDAQHPLDLLLTQHSPGDQLTLTVLRGGKTIEVPITLATRPAEQ